MSSTLEYAAYSYLDEYLRVDQRCISALSDEMRGDEEVCNALTEIATYYRIIRNLSPKRCEETYRLSPVLEELRKLERPKSSNDAVVLLGAFIEALDKRYGRKLISAASKILWMRFQSPVLIYDSLACEWLNEYDYPAFYGRWREEYKKVASKVENASRSLVNVKQFTLAAGMGDQELGRVVGANWFHERVFDHWIISQVDLGRRATSLQLKDGGKD